MIATTEWQTPGCFTQSPCNGSVASVAKALQDGALRGSTTSNMHQPQGKQASKPLLLSTCARVSHLRLSMAVHRYRGIPSLWTADFTCSSPKFLCSWMLLEACI